MFKLLPLSLFFPFSLLAQGNFPQIHTSAGLSMANTALHLQNTDAIAYNPAGIAHINELSASFQGINYWGITGITTWNYSFVLPSGDTDGFGFQLQGFRPGEFSLIKTGIAYGRKFTENTTAGLQFFYQAVTNAEKETLYKLCSEVGFQLNISTMVGFSALLTTSYPYSSESKSIFVYPDTYRSGFVFRPADFIILAFEINHGLNRQPEFTMGLEYQFAKQRYQWRMGFNWTIISFTTGFGWSMMGLHMDLGTRYHPGLGFTQALGLTKNFGKTKSKI